MIYDGQVPTQMSWSETLKGKSYILNHPPARLSRTGGRIKMIELEDLEILADYRNITYILFLEALKEDSKVAEYMRDYWANQAGGNE